MTIRRLSSRFRQLDQSFLAEQFQGARSYRRSAGYFTRSLFEVAHECLEAIPDVRTFCNVDLTPDDIEVARPREARMLGRWNERFIEAESLLNRERYQRLDDMDPTIARTAGGCWCAWSPSPIPRATDGIPYYDEEFDVPQSPVHAKTILYLAQPLEQVADRAGLTSLSDNPVWYWNP